MQNNKDAFYKYYDGKKHYEGPNEQSYKSMIRIDEYIDNQEALVKKQKEEQDKHNKLEQIKTER